MLLLLLASRVSASDFYVEGDVAVGVALLPASEPVHNSSGKLDDSGYGELFREYRLGLGYGLTNWARMAVLVNLQEEINGSDDDDEENDGIYTSEDLDGYDAIGVSLNVTLRLPSEVFSPYVSAGSQCSMVWIRARNDTAWNQSDCAARLAVGLEFFTTVSLESGHARLELARGAVGPLRYYTLGVGLTGFF